MIAMVSGNPTPVIELVGGLSARTQVMSLLPHRQPIPCIFPETGRFRVVFMMVVR